MTATSTVQSTAGRTARPVPPAVRHAGRATRPAGCPSARTASRPAPVRPTAARPTEVPRSGAHLTARGRAVVVAGLVLLLLAAFSLGRSVAEGSTAAPAGAALEQVTVLPGDTLWAVAERLAPGQDPRPVVDQIRRLNDLTSPELQAGQQLLLPAAP